MKRTSLYAALALAGLCGSAHAINVDFSGYFRAGVGLNVEGGTQVCFQAPGADTKWRLGNECDYVIEPTFSAKLASFEGSDWSVVFMPNAFQAYGGGNGGLNAGFGQVYAYGTNIASLGGATVWAGKRFYNRLQLGINDQFLENDDGDGAGLENINVGFGKLSVAYMVNPNGDGNDVNHSRFKIPVRITGIKTAPNGELALYVKGEKSEVSDDKDGNANPVGRGRRIDVGAYQTFNGLLFGGNTLFGVRYDEDKAVNDDRKQFRFVVQQTGKVGGTAWDFIGQYRQRDDANPAVANKWFSVGARTDTHLGGPFRFLFEAGHDQVKPDAGDTRNMTKLTAAVAASAGPDAGSRPTVRLFVTHALWNDAARLALEDARLREVFGDKKNGTTIGVQAEAWW